IASLKLNAGPTDTTSPLEIPSAPITLFVGPNHSGKSVLLREIQRSIPSENPARGKVLHSTHLHPLDPKRVEKWRSELKASATDIPASPREAARVRVQLGSSMHTLAKTEFESVLKGLDNFGTLRHAFHPWGHNVLNRIAMVQGGKERLGLLHDAERGDLRTKATSILGILFQNDDERRRLQEIIHDAFDWYLVVDPTVGNNFRAAVSPEKPEPAIERSLSEASLAYFQRCTSLSEMSDGVKAFCGMMAAVIASDAEVILIDEPEAFLTPAITINLAKQLCSETRQREQQLFIATHSAAFLMGCIQAGVGVNIVRLTYRKGRATSRMLSPGELTPLMRNPLLRSVGALNGLFYESVVVCEADADRSFYDEINHRTLTVNDARGIPECLFLNAQNWQTVGRVAAPLRKLGVAAAVIVDADVIQSKDSTGFQELLSSLGLPEGTRTALGQIRGKFHARTKDQKDALKSAGTSSLSGDDKGDFENFVTQLSAYGIFLVPCGELEGWLKTLTRPTWSGKAEWLISTFEAMGDDASSPAYLRATAGDVWDFIGKIRQWLHDPCRKGMPI
ncbi:MAG TPA: AAA family ATPase, partial [Candidatus Paceibacterota bacterium]